jgi:hypothetical protein
MICQSAVDFQVDTHRMALCGSNLKRCAATVSYLRELQAPVFVWYENIPWWGWASGAAAITGAFIAGVVAGVKATRVTK